MQTGIWRVQAPSHPFMPRVWAQGIPQQVRLFTVVVTPPVLEYFMFGVQHFAAQHTVKGQSRCKDPQASVAVWWRHGPVVLSIPALMIGSDVPLELGEGEELLVAAATFHWIMLLFQLPPVVRSVFHQIIFSLATPP